MLPTFHRPGAPLNAFVECLWYLPSYIVEHQRERTLPTGTMELVFNLGVQSLRVFRDDADVLGQRFHDSVVCGPHSRYFVLDTSRKGPVIGVHFHPGGTAPFFDLPSDELTNRHVALEDLWGPAAHELGERLREARTPGCMFMLLEHTLLARLQSPNVLHPAVAHAIRTLTGMPDVTRIRQVQNETGYSAKRFIELFRGSVGLTPKVYSRIRRFQAVIARAAQGDYVNWAGVAVDGGYYDQSHLNREFRRFSGITPPCYRPVTTRRPSHVAAE